MKFSNKAHVVASCGDVLKRHKTSGACVTCEEDTRWFSTTFSNYFCSDECLEQEINETLAMTNEWFETFR